MTTCVAQGEILTPGSVAGSLSLTERTIYWLAVAQQIPADKVGAKWRFSRADIDIWIKPRSTLARPMVRARGRGGI